MAYLEPPGAAVVSLSPELLLQVQSSAHLVSAPIKGTRPRGLHALGDQRLAHELKADPKERAEHVMIVDLVRSDLGRVCAPGSVVVNRPFEVQSFVGIQHMVSEVRGRMAMGQGPLRALLALFPGGSITGAPKVRACQIIAEVEGAQRGVYCGAVGYVDRQGGAALNIPIRTAVVTSGQFTTHAGGGIVVDSLPEREWAEVQLKAAGWLALFDPS
jgi:para-aminobenzoate synthetase component 1